VNQEKIVFFGQAVRILFGHEFLTAASRKTSLRAVMPIESEIIAEFAIATLMVPCRYAGSWIIHWYIVE
jgi:hypothetical protein